MEFRLPAKALLLLFFAVITLIPSLVRSDDFAKDRKAGVLLQKREERLQKKLKDASSSKIKSLISQLRSWRIKDRLTAVEQIGMIGVKAIPYLEKSLKSRNGYELRFAVAALGRIRHPKSLKALQNLIQDPRCTSPDRFYAVGVLASIGDPQSRKFLWDTVFHDREERVRRAAEVGLIKIEGPRLPALLLKSARKEKAAFDFLGRIHKKWTGQPEGDQGKLTAWAASKLVVTATKAIKRVYGDGYVCVTDIDDEAKVREPLQRLVEFRAALVRVLQPRRLKEWTSTIRLYHKRSRFNDYGATHEFNFIYFTEFYYSSLLREIVAFRGEEEGLLKRRLQHEIGHDVFEHLVGAVPLWLAEGICEVYEIGEVKDRRLVAPEVNQSWLTQLRLDSEAKTICSLESLLTMGGAKFYGADSAAHYAAAWSFCHFLIVKKGADGLILIRQVLETVRDSGLEKSTRAFKGPNDPRLLEKEWLGYIEELLR
jgi:hypothetical protein